MWKRYGLLFLIASQVTGQAYSQNPGASSPIQANVFRQNGSSITIDRDDQLRLTLNPEQFGAAGNGTGENGDDCEAINRAIRYAALGSGSNTPKILHLNGRNYRCSKANYQVLLPRDFGDYSADASGEGAQFSLNIVNGSIHSCDVSGGGGYNPASWVIGQIKDATYSGSGGAVHAMTDSKGIPLPGSCVVDSAGMNYPPTGVDIYSFAQGADGAMVRATLADGKFVAASSVTNNSSMPQGNGYRAPTFVLPAGLTCSRGPQFVGKVGTSGLSSTALLAVTIADSGSNCAYHGANSGDVPIWVGGTVDSHTAQAKNVAPSSTQTIGCAIQLRTGVSIEGEGATIQTDWQTGLYGTKEIVAFCDAYGNQATNISIRNLKISAPAGIWLSGIAKNFVIENVTELYGTTPMMHSTSYIPGSGGGLFFYAAQVGEGMLIRNVSNYAPGGIVVGGQYTSRGEAGLGSMGGIDVVRNRGAITYSRGGVADDLVVENYRQYEHLHGNNYNSELDGFFEQYVWHSDYTPADVSNTSRNSDSCPLTIKPLERSVQTSGASHVYTFPCYRGISDRPITILSRFPYESRHVNLSNIWEEQAYRSIILAHVTESRFSMVNLVALGTAYKDPYAGNGPHALIETPTSLPFGPVNYFEGVLNPDKEHRYFGKTLLGTSFADDRTSASSWQMVAGMSEASGRVAVQHVFSNPGTVKYTHGLGTLNPLSACYSSSPGASPVVSLIKGDTQSVQVTAGISGTVTCIFEFAPPAVLQ